MGSKELVGWSALGVVVLGLVAWLVRDDSRRSGPPAGAGEGTEAMGRVPLLPPDGPAEAPALVEPDRREKAVAAPPAEPLEVFVGNAALRPVAGAAVRADGARATDAVRTEASGWARVALAEARAPTFRTVHARAVDLGEASRTFPGEARHVAIALPPVETVLGIVRGPDGGFPPEGTRVLVWPKGHRPTAVEVERWLSTATPEGISLVSCDRDGRFRVEGLDTSIRQLVLAGGAGLAAPVFQLAPERREPIEMRLAPVQGARIEFADAQGGPRPLSAPQRLAVRLAWGSRDDALESCWLTEATAALAGFGAIGLRDDATGRTLLFLGPEGVSCDLSVRLPGFQSLQIGFRPTPVARGLARVPVALVPETTERGTLQIEPSGASPAVILDLAEAAPLAPGLDGFELDLRPTERGLSQLSLACRLLLDRPMRIEEIPTGTYTVHLLRLNLRLVANAGEPVTVRAGETLSVPLDVSDLSSVVVTPLEHGRVAYADRADFLIAPGVQLGGVVKDVATFSFERGPYVVGLLRAGTYTLRGRRPVWDVPGGANGSLTFELPAGRAFRLPVSVRR